MTHNSARIPHGKAPQKLIAYVFNRRPVLPLWAAGFGTVRPAKPV